MRGVKSCERRTINFTNEVYRMNHKGECISKILLDHSENRVWLVFCEETPEGIYFLNLNSGSWHFLKEDGTDEDLHFIMKEPDKGIIEHFLMDSQIKNWIVLEENYTFPVELLLLKIFEEETGIKVEYEEYESPEEMYAKYKAGSIHYDVACTSDYIIQKLHQEGETLEIDFSNIPEFKNIDKTYLDYCKNFDEDNSYTVPYFFGTVGILYNKTMVNPQETDTWNVLWDEKYAGQIMVWLKSGMSMKTAVIVSGNYIKMRTDSW